MNDSARQFLTTAPHHGEGGSLDTAASQYCTRPDAPARQNDGDARPDSTAPQDYERPDTAASQEYAHPGISLSLPLPITIRAATPPLFIKKIRSGDDISKLLSAPTQLFTALPGQPLGYVMRA